MIVMMCLGAYFITILPSVPAARDYSGDRPLVTYCHGELKGDMVYSWGDSYYSGSINPGGSYTVRFNLNMPVGASVKVARLYSYWTWSHIGSNAADPVMDVTFDGDIFRSDAEYTDRKGAGGFDYPTGNYAYDVTADVKDSGAYAAVVRNAADDSRTFCMNGCGLLVIYEHPDPGLMEYWVNEGCDMLSTGGGLTPEQATATAVFGGKAPAVVKNATLWTVVQSGACNTNKLFFNDKNWTGVYGGTPTAALDVDERNVTEWLIAEDNTARMQAVGDHCAPSNAFLRLRKEFGFLHLSIPPEVNAGQSFDITVTAYDKFGNLNTSYTGKINFTSTDPVALLPADLTFTPTDHGVKKFTNVVLYTSGDRSITVTDVLFPTTGNDTNVTAVNNGPLDHFVFEHIESPRRAGIPFEITIKAFDRWDNTVTERVEKTRLSDSTGSMDVTETGTFDGGVWTGRVTITRTRAGVVIKAVHPPTGKNGTSNVFDVVVPSGVADHLSIGDISSPRVAGIPFNVTVTAEDVYGNDVPDFTGSVYLCDSTGTLSPSGPVDITGGKWTGAVTITKADDNITISAEDSATGHAAAGNEFTVVAAGLHHLGFGPISGTPAAGEPFNVTLVALDPYDNTELTFAGTVELSDSTGSLAPMGSSAFLSGRWTGEMTIIKASRNVMIKAIEPVSGCEGLSEPFNVTCGGLDHFTIATISGPKRAGVPFDIAITAEDAFNNTVTTFAGTVWLSGVSGPALPAKTGYFTEGTWAGRAAVTKADENNSISAVEPYTGSTGRSNTFPVEPGEISRIDVFPVSCSTYVNETIKFNATGYDAYGNEIRIEPDWKADGGGMIDNNEFTARSEGLWVVSAGIGGITGRVQVSVAVIRPDVTIISPADNTGVRGVVTIRGSAFSKGNGIQNVEVRIDGGPWTSANGTEEWGLGWDTKGVLDGRHTIHARARNDMVYSNVTSVCIFVENTEGTGRDEEGSKVGSGLVTGCIIAAVFVIIVFSGVITGIMIMRKKQTR